MTPLSNLALVTLKLIKRASNHRLNAPDMILFSAQCVVINYFRVRTSRSEEFIFPKKKFIAMHIKQEKSFFYACLRL
jgi:hypothetical protein